ncbi:response regulator [Citrifermentans bremense]|uniref:response regulator n=1 Tax=Citrifermentans bremense TaxID=60035 RepID=UPI000685A69A|nr:response regulator [Citrifermentans bremense]
MNLANGKEMDDKMGISILVVEDSAIQAEILKRMLVREGYKVSVARNGAEGLVRMQESPPALVLSDVVMPVMDGYEMCRAIKDTERFRRIPVVLLTQLYESEEILRGLQSGADAYMLKAVSEDLILTKVRSLTENPFQFASFDYQGTLYDASSERAQTLSFLMSTYESAIWQSQELTRAQGELRSLTELMEVKVKERTKSLTDQIEERKRTEEELRCSEEKFEYLFANSVMAKVITFPDGRMEVNTAFSDMLGYALEELEQRTWQEIMHPEEIMRYQNAMEDMTRGALKSARLTSRYLHRTGKTLWVNVGLALRLNEQETPLYFFSDIDDITQKR